LSALHEHDPFQAYKALPEMGLLLQAAHSHISTHAYDFSISAALASLEEETPSPPRDAMSAVLGGSHAITYSYQFPKILGS
jgi:hypothetical protein